MIRRFLLCEKEFSGFVLWNGQCIIWEKGVICNKGRCRMRKISNEKLQEYLNEILACNAFELHKKERCDGRADYYIPYMMNDALESYLILQNGTMTGVYDSESDAEITAELHNTDQGPAAFFRQGEGSVFTIWYEQSSFELQCYRYDQIGHFWVEGEEHWRRLVYIVGTIHDKFSYMGERVCSKNEQKLMALMGFAPFRYFSPINESLDSYYEETADGLMCMRTLAEEAGDKEFLRLIRLYRFPLFKKQMVRLLTKAMQSPKRNRLYQLIFKKVEEAASEYPERTYQDGLHDKIKDMREKVQEQLLKRGFCGSYPLFHKGNIQVLAMEEHPFTILESEQYGFRIQYMVSEIDEKSACGTTQGASTFLLNAGFFQKSGNRGWIAKELDFRAGL